jgi:hypothetical protein
MEEREINFIAGDDFTEEMVPEILSAARKWRRHVLFLAKKQGVIPEDVQADVDLVELEKQLHQIILKRQSAS